MESANADGNAVYDTIGVGYSAVRRSDPRIGHQLHRGLGDASTILNVGAGTGSYEPADRDVIAVEPSMEMISQRSNSHARCVRGVAERLPFPAGSFDAAMAILTVHHWSDPVSGLHELRRVTSGPIIVLTFDAHVHNQQWFTTEYLPEIITMDTDAGRHRRHPRRGLDRDPPGSVRLHRRLRPCVVAATGGLSRPFGPRRHLGHRPARRVHRGPRDATTQGRSRLGEMAQRTRGSPDSRRDRRRLPDRHRRLSGGRGRTFDLA
jgi:hypothetical protein